MRSGNNPQHNFLTTTQSRLVYSDQTAFSYAHAYCILLQLITAASSDVRTTSEIQRMLFSSCAASLDFSKSTSSPAMPSV